MFPVSWIIQSRLADVATIVDENVNGVRVVKSFAAEQQQLRSLSGAADRLRWSYIKDEQYVTFSVPAGPVNVAPRGRPPPGAGADQHL